MPDEKSSQPPAGNSNEQRPAVTQANTVSEQKPKMRETSNSDSKQHESETKELAREIHWVEKATLWSQLGLGAIGVAALFIYHGQLAVMQRQLDEMAKSNKAANASAAAAKAAVDLTNESMRVDKRSWVGITHPITLNHFIVDRRDGNYEIGYTFIIKNFGPSVALHVMSEFLAANRHTVRKALDDSCEDASKYQHQRRTADGLAGGYLLFPGDEMRSPGNELGNIDRLDSDGALYIAGCIIYNDQFGTKHTTHTCVQTFSDIDFGAISPRPQVLYVCPSEAN